MNVKNIPRISGILLIITTIIFVISILIPDFHLKTPHTYILNQIVLPIIGGLILLFTYVFAIMSYSRELFTANPQRIVTAYQEQTDTSKLTIRTYIVDKMDMHIYILSLKLEVSHNYEINEVAFNGAVQDKFKSLQDNESLYSLNRIVNTDFTIIIEMRDNKNDTEERFLRFTVSYKKGKKWFHITYDETHKILWSYL